MSSKSSVVRYPLFVYGTLQPGFGNFDLIENDVIEIHEGATTNGRVYFVAPGGGYPVAKLVGEKGTIHGTLLICNAGGRGLAVAQDMEEGAGYVSYHVPVYLPDGKRKFAFAYHFVGTPRGDLIESGDWATEVRRGVR